MTENKVSKFRSVNPQGAWEEINTLNRSKQTGGEVSTTVVKLTSKCSFIRIIYFLNQLFSEIKIPENLKLFEVYQKSTSRGSTVRITIAQ